MPLGYPPPSNGPTGRPVNEPSSRHNSEPGAAPLRLPAQRIPPSHDYIRQHASAPAPVGAVHKFGYTRQLKNHEQQSGADPPADLAADPAGDPTPFVHLHVHSNFSFLDGGSRIEELVARAAELGQPALALTDHDGLYGAVRFAKACAKHGIKPIFGAEVRVESLLPGAGTPAAGAADGTDPVGPIGPVGEPACAPGAPPRVGAGAAATGRATSPAYPHHLVLLAETREGYANLCRLISAAHLADPERERPPTVTIESLAAHAQGLICLTGCRHGEIGSLIDTGRDEDARAALLRLREVFGPDALHIELQYFGYEPHQEAHAGQHGSPVYEKIRADGNRLRHRPTSPPVAALEHASPGLRASCPVALPADAHPAQGDPAVPVSPRLAAGAAAYSPYSPALRGTSSATLVASWRTALTEAPERSATRREREPRPDLPRGAPQRLNPADFDVGFYRDGKPWRLSCLTYCERLARLAAACGLGTVLTTNAHYAGKNDRALHLVCRAAGRDQPLSGYPEPVPGVRCLQSKAELESFAAPLLELVADQEAESAPDWWGDWAPSDYGLMHEYCNATYLAPRGDPGAGARDGSDAWDGAAGARAASPLTATWQIAQRCNVDLDLGTFHFPLVDVPAGETAYSLLTKRCFRGIARQYKPVPPRAVELLEKELRMIQQMGFAHYFLVVHDIVRWARARGVACSGRGSAGNSIVCHALDITASEPIRHNLLFERFLNPNRREMPDIDVDFCSSRRDEVIDHIYKTFGDQNVAVVANVNTMSPRSAVRIVAEALGFAPTEINALAKHVPHHGDAARIREYLAGAWPELKDSPLQDGAAPPGAPHTPSADGAAPDGAAPDGAAAPDPPGRGAQQGAAAPSGGAAPSGDPHIRSSAPAPPRGRYARFLDLVERLDAFPMHLGTHLGGFVIADRPITYYAPLQWAAKGVVVLQFNKDDVAALGLVKMDILGLRTHSAVSETVHLIRQRTGRRIRPYELPPDDPAAYEIVSNGGSIGLFQLESAGQRNLASRLQERDFDDVIAAIALYRPGPLEAEMIGPFIDRRWGLEPVVLPHPAMAEAVADTYGVILYQEQVLRIAQSVAGFDLADADSLRRAMTRDRSREEMAKIGETFIAGAIRQGVPPDAAREVFRQLEGFAAYGFNKSHSVCFAVIAYATAYLKAYYPAEFLCSVLNNYPMGFYTPRTVLNDARRFGLEVRPLDINLSGRGFTVEDDTPPDPCDPYDPFAQAWTAEHHWGLTEADLAELAAEQEGESAYAEALRVALEQGFSDDDHRRDAAKSGAVLTGSAAPPAASLTPGGESPPAGAAREAPPLPGDLPLPRAPRARGGVEPGACLAPSTGIAPDAGRALRVGFKYLKQMGDRSLDRIEQERRHGPFTSFEDFYLRTRLDCTVAENLIRVGAFDSLEPDRTELLWRLPLLHDRLEALAGSSGGRRGQLRAFFSPPSRAGLERRWSLEDKVRSELELLGLTVSCHPLSLYEEELRRMGVRMSYELPSMGDEVPVTVAGVYERAQNPWMRSGKRTMFLTLEDAYGLYECVCFESKLARIAPVVARASYFLVRGRLQNNHKRGLAIVAEEVWDLEEVLARRKTGKCTAVVWMASRAGPSDQAKSTTPEIIDPWVRAGIETYSDGTASTRKRPPGTGTGAIPKRVG